jgi:hypothetical protein
MADEGFETEATHNAAAEAGACGSTSAAVPSATATVKLVVGGAFAALALGLGIVTALDSVAGLRGGPWIVLALFSVLTIVSLFLAWTQKKFRQAPAFWPSVLVTGILAAGVCGYEIRNVSEKPKAAGDKTEQAVNPRPSTSPPPAIGLTARIPLPAGFPPIGVPVMQMPDGSLVCSPTVVIANVAQLLPGTSVQQSASSSGPQFGTTQQPLPNTQTPPVLPDQSATLTEKARQAGSVIGQVEQLLALGGGRPGTSVKDGKLPNWSDPASGKPNMSETPRPGAKSEQDDNSITVTGSKAGDARSDEGPSSTGGTISPVAYPTPSTPDPAPTTREQRPAERREHESGTEATVVNRVPSSFDAESTGSTEGETGSSGERRPSRGVHDPGGTSAPD